MQMHRTLVLDSRFPVPNTRINNKVLYALGCRHEIKVRTYGVGGVLSARKRINPPKYGSYNILFLFNWFSLGNSAPREAERRGAHVGARASVPERCISICHMRQPSNAAC